MKPTPKQPRQQRRAARPAAESKDDGRWIRPICALVSPPLTPERARELAEAFRKAYAQFADKP